MTKRAATIITILCVIGILITYFMTNNHKKQSLKVAISPYQDIAMIVNIKNLELEKKYQTSVELLTMNWEEIVPSVVSAGETVDIGFGSLNEYLTKSNNINADTDDSLLFIYPAYIFKGGGFISFNKTVPTITSNNINDTTLVKSFLQNKIGAQKSSLYEMMIFSLAKKCNYPYSNLKLYDTPLNDGLLATQKGSLDISAAGLTQITETIKNNGKVVLTMEDLGFADVTGFICKKSILESKRAEIEDLIKMWFECVSFVYSDLPKNSKYSLKYLDEKAATKYTFEQYQTALSQEYFPLSIEEANRQIKANDGKFSYKRISDEISNYLTVNKAVTQKPKSPNFIEIAN